MFDKYDIHGDGTLCVTDFRKMLAAKDVKSRTLLLCRPYLPINQVGRQLFCVQTNILFTRALKLLLDKEDMRVKLKAKNSNDSKISSRLEIVNLTSGKDEEITKLENIIGITISKEDIKASINRS